MMNDLFLTCLPTALRYLRKHKYTTVRFTIDDMKYLKATIVFIKSFENANRK